MKEIRDIVAAYDLAQKEGKRSALATVVHVEGSSYRRPGARMLVTDDGQLTGAISGGCLEGDALQKALFAINQQQNKLVIYDTTDDDDVQFGVQLGCNGIVHILFEPIDDTREMHAIRLLRELAGERKDAVLVTLFSLERSAEQPGTCLMFRDGKVKSPLSDDWRDDLMSDIKKSAGEKRSLFREYPRDQNIFYGLVEFLPPPPALVIAGAGNDVLPLVEMTHLLGWHTTVVDGRPFHATVQRFAKASRVFVSKPENVLEWLMQDGQTTADSKTPTLDGQTFFLLMTHNYNYDLALLKELITKEFLYIGILGPRKKLDRMLDELRAGGMAPGPDQLAAIHSPVGLDIGAETAEEIAVSIIAEIKAFLTGAAGGPLKDKQEPIHSRPANISSHG
jgi:xanthine dehydrogenase accessory factor